MKASELRVNNFIYDHNGEISLVAYATYENVIGIQLGNGAVQKYEDNPIISGKIIDLKPIPLTEEWLLKFGFNTVSYIATGDFIINGTKRLIPVNDYEYNIIVYALDYNKWCLKIETNPRLEDKHRKEVNISLKYFKHVHTLQNLYFALTGKELNYVSTI